jgi:hypothetical protein
MDKLILGRYTRRGLWTLFLMCALPLHAWTMILAFRDLSWLTERTNAWDAVGVLCYGLVFALVESVIVFVVMVLLGFLVPGKWEAERRVGLLSALVLILSMWAMLEQLFFLAEVRLPGWLIDVLVRTGHPLRVLYVVIPLVVGATFVYPAWRLMRSRRAVEVMSGAMEKLSLLAMFYLVFDVGAIVVVVIRNL